MLLETWLLYTAAIFVVILIPGPLSLLMVSNSLNYGIMRTTPAFLGGVSASVLLLTASALGLGALLMASEQLFSTLKILGALYLFYLAWRSWREASHLNACALADKQRIPGFKAMFWQAFGLGASNPKDILFFAAFLPQFISADSPLLSQLLIMIITWACADLICKLGYGLCARGAARFMTTASSRAWFSRFTAGIFASAGTAALLSR
ncbi:LysE family translocator [Marinobacterium sedimentorum]|uniref:LysE family translocator n=1 Tax=Marinobacterium sedimentorum TaxID=2927804 RepID=UPI0020C5D46C|nr:LysE family translocator [Marinobacterium sedimentorum]MCP8688524.1 LysE family translocator [Marinobacterium sedimentorum]